MPQPKFTHPSAICQLNQLIAFAISNVFNQRLDRPQVERVKRAERRSWRKKILKTRSWEASRLDNPFSPSKALPSYWEVLSICLLHHITFIQLHKKEEESKRARVPSSLLHRRVVYCLKYMINFLHRRKKQDKEKGKKKRKKQKEKLLKDKKPRIIDDEE